MWFNVSQFIEIWLFPPGLNLFLILFGFFVWRFRPLFGKTLITIGILSLWVFSTPIISQLLIDRLQYQYPVLSADKITDDGISAIVVLAAGLMPYSPEYGNPDVSDPTFTRLRYAAYLNKKMNIPILVSGSYPKNTLTLNVTKYMAKSLKDTFNAATKWQEDRGSNTALEGVFAAQILKAANVSKIYLVTHAIHMPRSMYAFKDKGLQVIPAPTGFMVPDECQNKLFIFLPTISALRGSQIALHEYVGLLWYRLQKI